MNFDDLPEEWDSIPLTDPDHIANVLDLFVSLEARRNGCLLMLICDEERLPVQPVLIDHMPACPPADALPFLAQLGATIGERPGAGVLVAIGRQRKLRVTANDLAWRATIERAFSGHVEVLGVHVITYDGTLPVLPPEVAA